MSNIFEGADVPLLVVVTIKADGFGAYMLRVLIDTN
jgi:hypothetical protein